MAWRVREPTLRPCPNEIINRNAVAAFHLSQPWATLTAAALRLELLVARGPYDSLNEWRSLSFDIPGIPQAVPEKI
jgi:hypothetical protein